MASDKENEERFKLLLEVAQNGSGLIPNDERWRAIERRLARAMRHGRPPWRDPNRRYVLRESEGDSKGYLKQVTETAIRNAVSWHPEIAVEVITLITSEPRLIRNYWFLRILEIASFAEYGMEIPRITRRYLDLLMTRERLRELMTELQEREGSTSKAQFGNNRAVESEAGMTLVEVHKRLAEVSAYAVENFHAYLLTTFRNNLLKAVNYDDTNLSVDEYEETEWARKLKRRKKQSLDRLESYSENQSEDDDSGDKVDALLKPVSPPRPEEALIASGSYLLESIPAGRLRKVAILRYVEDLTQPEVAKQLSVTERTVRTDEEKIKSLVRKKVNP